MAHSTSELQVITFAKNLCNYVMTITQKSPKQFRFFLAGRIQGCVPDIAEELYYANDIYVTPNPEDSRSLSELSSSLELWEYMENAGSSRKIRERVEQQYRPICVNTDGTAGMGSDTDFHLIHAHLWASFAPALCQPSSPYQRVRFRPSSLI